MSEQQFKVDGGFESLDGGEINGTLDMSNFAVINLGTPTTDTGAATSDWISNEIATKIGTYGDAPEGFDPNAPAYIIDQTSRQFEYSFQPESWNGTTMQNAVDASPATFSGGLYEAGTLTYGRWNFQNMYWMDTGIVNWTPVEFSVECTFETIDSNIAEPILFNQENSVEVKIQDGVIWYAIWTVNEVWAWISTGHVVSPTVETHVILTYKSGTFRIYVNGVQVYSSSAHVGNVAVPTTTMKFNARSTGTSIGRNKMYQFAGYNIFIDSIVAEARYNEVKALYGF